MDSWIVSQRWVGWRTRSYRPTSTDLPLSFCAACSAHFPALPTRSCWRTYSHPRPAGATTLLRVWKSELSGATAVAVNGTATRTIVCDVTVPSVDAKLRSSFTNRSPELTKRTPFTLSASAFALSNRSARCSIGIVKGSIVNELFHVAFGYACTGESTTG